MKAYILRPIKAYNTKRKINLVKENTYEMNTKTSKLIKMKHSSKDMSLENSSLTR